MANLSFQSLDKNPPHLLPKRRNDYDVTNQVQVTDPDAVKTEVCRLYQLHYPLASTKNISQAYVDFTRLFMGEYPGYHAADTPYHDLQHTLDVSLAMMRLLISYNSSQKEENRIEADLAELGIITALFHDSGYIRQLDDIHAHHGAVYTKTHVSRSANFLALYLPRLGLSDQIKLAEHLVHFTGYEIAVDNITVDSPKHRILGCILGSSDLMAQMADRCYLEKCRDRLYLEFMFAGLARPETDDNTDHSYIFDSRDDVMQKTPDFMQVAIDVRLNETLGAVHNYMDSFFDGNNLYMQNIEKNRDYLKEKLTNGGWQDALCRTSPWTLTSEKTD